MRTKGPKTKDTPDNRKVAVYCRVSTHNQGQGEYSSLDSQESDLRAYTQAKGWTVYSVYIDTKTGTTLERDELTRLIHDAREKKFDVVAITKLDRISRSVRDFLELDDTFTKLGIDIVVTKQNIDTTTSAGKMQRTIMLAFAEFERDMIAERTREKLFSQAQKGYWGGGHAPLGYESKDKKLVVVPGEASIVVEIFGRYLEYQSISKVVNYLNSRPFKTKLRRSSDGTRTTGGGDFALSTVGGILNNRIYVGLISYKKELFKGLHEPIISNDIFNEVQKQLVQSKKVLAGTHKNTELELLGVTQCGHCGSALTSGYTTKQNGVRYHYYTCTKKTKAGGQSCDSWNIPADELHKITRKLATYLVNRKDFFTALGRQIVSNSNNERDRCSEEIAMLSRRIENINRDLKNYSLNLARVPDLKDLPVIATEMKDLQKELDEKTHRKVQIECALNSIKEKSYNPESMHWVMEQYDRIYDSLDTQRRQEANRLLFEAIISHIDKRTKKGDLDLLFRGDGRLRKAWSELVNSGSQNYQLWLRE